ncbi:hypothetical protein PV328_006411 [Microctonus aethiopoides]|uniref:Uncharacterized protein n=1 Tax=Microctonus aethiopoides TaxID=144406 RepID=A0AA39FPC0_9HYME|nr:hypothetical protein PV328_006411 [Microctonus aethiopoides]
MTWEKAKAGTKDTGDYKIIRGMSNEEKPPPGLTIDRAAFLLLRVKRAFKKKKQQRKEKSLTGGECKPEVKSTVRPGGNGGSSCCRPAPLLRSRTLPAIVVPGLNILQKQIDARYANNDFAGPADVARQAGSPTAINDNSTTATVDSSSTKRNLKLLAPRILFTDDTFGERRVSESGVSSRQKTIQSEENVGHSGYRLSTGNILVGSQPLTRLAKLLNQKPNYTPSDDIPRRLSWERRGDDAASFKTVDSISSAFTTIPRSASIDSIACITDWRMMTINTPSNTLVADLHEWDWRRGSDNSDIRTEPCSPAPSRRSPSPSPSLTPYPSSTNLLKGRSNERQSLVSTNIRRIKGHRAVVCK